MISDGAVIGAFVFMLALLALVFLAAGIVHICRDWAEDRAREARLAEEWRLTHKRQQDVGRYGYEVEGRPE